MSARYVDLQSILTTFSPGLRTHFKNLNSVNYHLYKNLFRLTPKNVCSYLRVFTVVGERCNVTGE